jgi:hypothetical protein
MDVFKANMRLQIWLLARELVCYGTELVRFCVSFISRS